MSHSFQTFDVRRLACRSALMLVALMLLGGCGGGDDSSSSTSGSDGDDQESEVLPIDRYADKELSELSLAQLQECESDTTFSHRVLYDEHEADAQCGTGTASVKVGSTSFEIEHGWCEIDDDYVNYHFGTTVLDISDDPTYGPAAFSLSMGAQIKGAKPVADDGTYVDGPSTRPAYRSNLVIEHDPDTWSGDTLYHPTTVTLTDGRTSGTVKATDSDGTPITVTFECGDRITGTAAPAAA